MKTLNILSQSKKSGIEKAPVKSLVQRLLKILPLILLLSSALSLSSCIFPGPEHGHHGGGMNDHGREHHESHDHDSHHD
jgi:hypothetical protein